MGTVSAVDVQGRVWAIEEVATLPSTLVRILSIVQDDSTTALDLAEEVASDQSLTLKILGTVNSSYYGFHRQIRSIPEAVVILGFDEVERLALAISVMDLFGRDKESARTLHMLWRHSLACSVVAGCIESQRRSRMPKIAGAHVAGLLHDIGKAVIAQYFPGAVRPILRLMQEDGLSACEAEREVLDGWTHCDIGAWIGDRWDLPPAIVESIKLHHTPELAGIDQPLVHATHVANVLCNRAGLRSVNANGDAAMNPQSAELLNIDSSVVTNANERLDKQRGLIGAVAAGGGY